jgi:hypothetical protein
MTKRAVASYRNIMLVCVLTHGALSLLCAHAVLLQKQMPCRPNESSYENLLLAAAAVKKKQ